MPTPEQKELHGDQNYIIIFEDDVPSEIVFDNHTIKILAPAKDRPNVPAELYENADDKFHELIDEGYMPVITIPSEFLETIEKNGIHPRETYIPGLRNISGTIGVAPYETKGRLLAIVKNKDIAERLHFRPRFTGKDKKFQGVISTLRGIPPEDFILITPEELEHFRAQQKVDTKISGIRQKIRKNLKVG